MLEAPFIRFLVLHLLHFFAYYLKIEVNFWHGQRLVDCGLKLRNFVAFWQFQVVQTVLILIKVMFSFSLNVPIIYIISDMLVLLFLLLDQIEAVQSSIQGKKSFLFGSTVILNHFVHLRIIDYEENVDLAHL